MKTKLTATLAVLLLAGASGAAMAQDRDHGERGQAAPQAHPQPQHAGPPPGGGGHPGGPPHMEGGQRGPGARESGPGDHGGPPPGAFRGGQERAQQAPAGAPQHFNRDAGPGPGAPRQFDQRRGEQFPSGRADTRGAQFGGSRGAPQHWQPGRFPPVMSAQNRFRAGYYRPPYGYYSRAWGFGDFLPRPWFARDYWLDDFLDFDLPYPPPGYTWVRVGPDALMIDRFTGRIVQVVREIFW
ncbi:RcnB family protein [Phenylobacterium sp.]|uniref:RcnB family protein n=1 Tax=Phenylobacterium sp. TaxID=1871053 RepID=UPI002C8867AB|nr:RcnB family protein [Phenylobacterium sp.]HLZ75704.1 RcnB family protein [Phenylobacterium sp.]